MKMKVQVWQEAKALPYTCTKVHVTAVNSIKFRHAQTKTYTKLFVFPASATGSYCL